MTSVMLFDNGDFSQHAKLVCTSNGTHQLKFTTRLKSSRHPDEERIAFSLNLDDQGLIQIRSLLQAGEFK